MRRRRPVLFMLLYGAPCSSQAQAVAEARDMALAGYSDLQGHSAYQTVIQRQAERWIAYIGHDGGSAARPLTGRTESREPRQMAWMVDVSVKAHPGVASHSGGECAH